MNQSEALAPIVRMGRMVVGTALTIALAAAGMAFLSARTVTRPVKRLVEGAEEIGRGNLDHQVGTSAGDEIGELSRAFDRMTLDLKTTTVSRDELGREKIFSDSATNSLPGVFYLFNKEDRFVRWNRNFEQVTEYSAEEISTMTPLGFFSQEQQQLVANEIERSFIKGETWVEADLLTKNGRTIPFYFTGHRMRMGDEYLLAGEGIDISELKQKERELEDKNAELERFTYAISHDLKSPLVTIKTFLGYLKQDLSRADTERIDQDMAYMLSAADKMGRLLDELLEMSRIGRLSTPPEHVLFGELVGEALSAVAGPLALRGVEVRVGDEVIPLFGDRPRLVEIWQNLVEKAVKFMGDESNPCIEIGV
jgi:PAS domain S-box-containing protein